MMVEKSFVGVVEIGVMQNNDEIPKKFNVCTTHVHFLRL